jgi:hypothetical protein
MLNSSYLFLIAAAETSSRQRAPRSLHPAGPSRKAISACGRPDRWPVQLPGTTPEARQVLGRPRLNVCMQGNPPGRQCDAGCCRGSFGSPAKDNAGRQDCQCLISHPNPQRTSPMAQQSLLTQGSSASSINCSASAWAASPRRYGSGISVFVQCPSRKVLPRAVGSIASTASR